MIITNEEEVKMQIMKAMEEKLESALDKIVYEIVEELPKGHASSIADDLQVQKVVKYSGGAGSTEFQILASDTWIMLNDGTGVYNPEHAGAGEGGRIVPLYSKALHFKNAAIAEALGFPTEDVFLKSVKGIAPRFFWDRNFKEERINEYMAKA